MYWYFERSLFQHTAARRRLEGNLLWLKIPMSFQPQPPEGGWIVCLTRIIHNAFSFNTQPPEGGWIFL